MNQLANTFRFLAKNLLSASHLHSHYNSKTSPNLIRANGLRSGLSRQNKPHPIERKASCEEK